MAFGGTVEGLVWVVENVALSLNERARHFEGCRQDFASLRSAS